MNQGSLALLLFSASLAFGCGGTTGSGFTKNDGGGSDAPSLETDAHLFLDTGRDDGGGGGGDANSDCSEAAKLVYVIDDTGVLHSFDPSALKFTTIGATHCPGSSGMTNSMAVDRSATAWVNDVNGRLYKVSTADASCQATGFVPGQHGFGPQFGMGFSANAAGSSAETLYLDGIGGNGLAWLDLTSMVLTPIGHFGGALAFDDCELTGTGDGRLFGFFTNTPASVAEIDKSNAAILSNAPQPGVNTGTDWAFSFWGGSFYLYTADQTVNPADTSDVTQYDPAKGSTGVVLSQIGFRIVGAGVSTCAPVVPPPVK